MSAISTQPAGFLPVSEEPAPLIAPPYGGAGVAVPFEPVAAPRTVSQGGQADQGLLQAALPALYHQQHDLVMRFLSVFEEMLDTPVAVLDYLREYFVPGVAPTAMIDEVARWFGVEADTEVALRAGIVAVSSGRGTHPALARQLAGALPNKRFTITESPGVSLTITFEQPLDQTEAAVARRCLDEHCPAHLASHVTAPDAAASPADEHD